MDKLFWTNSELPQGSEAWKQFRGKGLGGSEVACLMGQSPWESPHDLWMMKLGMKAKEFTPEQEARMVRGAALEPEAVTIYERLSGQKYEQMCAIHPEHHWMRISLDGISLSRDRIIEVKCPDKKNQEKQTKATQLDKGLKPGQVPFPEYRYAQIQHALAVMKSHFGITFCDYISYVPGFRPVVVRVHSNDGYQRELIRRESVLMDHISSRAVMPQFPFVERPGGIIAAPNRDPLVMELMLEAKFEILLPLDWKAVLEENND